MLKYIFSRILVGILTLFILATITFFLSRAIPGDPFTQDNKSISPETYAAMEAKYGLNKPLFDQYVIFLKNAVTMDFGESISKKGQEVTDIILKRAPVTAVVGSISFVFAVTTGIGLGIVGALTKKRSINAVITFIATLGVSLPNFLLAIGMMILFGVQLGLVKLVGLSSWTSYILPCIALAFGPISMITRLTRASLQDVMNKDYIILARSKGTNENIVVIKHGLKNALLPIVTYCGPMFAGLITGSFVIETLFTIPGIGSEFTSSVTNRDYTLIMGLTIFLGVVVITMNIITDIVAAIIDPRIKLGK